MSASEQPNAAQDRTSPLSYYVGVAMSRGVSQETAWAMWRVVFPKATRAIFREEWKYQETISRA